MDYSPKGLRMAETCWWYYISKFTEFFDTLFFLLRKKNQHVSTLHVIHHGVMPFSGEYLLDTKKKPRALTSIGIFCARLRFQFGWE